MYGFTAKSSIATLNICQILIRRLRKCCSTCNNVISSENFSTITDFQQWSDDAFGSLYSLASVRLWSFFLNEGSKLFCINPFVVCCRQYFCCKTDLCTTRNSCTAINRQVLKSKYQSSTLIILNDLKRSKWEFQRIIMGQFSFSSRCFLQTILFNVT